jgi:hypothetical protein
LPSAEKYLRSSSGKAERRRLLKAPGVDCGMHVSCPRGQLRDIIRKTAEGLGRLQDIAAILETKECRRFGKFAGAASGHGMRVIGEITNPVGKGTP